MDTCAECGHDEISHAIVGRLAFDTEKGWVDAEPAGRECLADAAPGNHEQCPCAGYRAAPASLVGETFNLQCTDRTGATGRYPVTVDRVSVSGGVEYAHFARPRGDASEPAVHAPRMNTYVAALRLHA